MADDVTLMLGDCLDLMGDIPDGSVDLVLADPPYGTTRCAWDVIIPIEPMWEGIRRVLRPGGAVVLTSKEPFTSMLVMSNLKWFRHDRPWDQKTRTGFLNASKCPMRGHQDIRVFAPGRFTYNPIMVHRTDAEISRLMRERLIQPERVKVYNEGVGSRAGDRDRRRYKHPSSIITISSREGAKSRGLHPTQKPIALMEYLIKTYSNPGDLVLDPCMGSGTTLIAAINTGRRAIGIEKDPAIFATASSRIAAHRTSTPLFADAPAR